MTVFERSSGALRDRGSGIAIPVDLRNELIEHDYLSAGYRCWPDDATPDDIRRAGTRRWVIADGSPSGRLLWEQPSGGAAVCNNWRVLWQGLRARVPDASYRDVTAPNADTLYTTTWIDVSKEPWILSLPDMKDRYFLFPMLDGWTNVFQVPGKRTTGTKAQTYAITGPGWSGDLPPGVTEYKSPTGIVWILGRIYCTGTPEDYKAVHA